MKLRSLLTLIALITSMTTIAEVPDVDDFRVVPQFPQPADSAFGVVGSNRDDGRFLFWDGDTIYQQDTPGGSELTPIASGYLGDPGFISVNPNDNRALLGSGFGNGITANLYLLDLSSPEDFEEGTQIIGPAHFAGKFLNDSLVILDRGKADFSGSELIVLDIFAAETRGTTPKIVLQLPESDKGTRLPIIDKPALSYASLVHVDFSQNRVYAMDANTSELRWFSRSDIITAFNDSTTLDWNKDGTPIGVPGDFFTGGLSGITPDGELVIGGSAGVGLPGGIQYIDPDDPVTILDTLDPAGDMPFYNVIYNRPLDEMVAIDATFGVPIQAYATDMGIAPIPPENPCDDEQAIRDQMELFIEDFSILTDDIDSDEIPDLATLELILLVSCLYTEEAVIAATHNAYDFNLEALDDEPQSEAVAPYREALASLMCISSDMQSALAALLQLDGITLTQSYVAVTCSDVETCLPEYEEDPDPDMPRNTPRTAEESYSGSGDIDFDDLTNLEEYNNVVGVGGDYLDYAIAAFSDELTGNNGLTGGGSGGGCLIATAAYGSPVANELSMIRMFRNEYLLPNIPGTFLSDTYYRISSSLTPWAKDHPVVLQGIRGTIVMTQYVMHHLFSAIFLFTIALIFIRSKYSIKRLRF